MRLPAAQPHATLTLSGPRVQVLIKWWAEYPPALLEARVVAPLQQYLTSELCVTKKLTVSVMNTIKVPLPGPPLESRVNVAACRENCRGAAVALRLASLVTVGAAWEASRRARIAVRNSCCFALHAPGCARARGPASLGPPCQC